MIGERRVDAGVHHAVLLQVARLDREARFAPAGANVDELDAELADEARLREDRFDQRPEPGVLGVHALEHSGWTSRGRPLII